MNSEKEYTIEPSGARLMNIAEIWRYRELFYFFTWRDIKVKYKQTLLGFLWAILQPLLMMAIFTFCLGSTLKIPPQNLPYPVFVYSGLLIWNIFSAGLVNSSNSMITNAPIIKKIYFPRIVIPVSSILGALFDFLMAFTLFFVLLIAYNQSVSMSALFYWPAAVVVSFVATLGPGSLLAALNVKYRDFRYVIPFIIQALLFLTPVIYPINLLEYQTVQYLIALSPVYAAIELFRMPLTGLPPDQTLMTISLCSGIFFLFLGLYYFRRTEDFFADLA